MNRTEWIGEHWASILDAQSNWLNICQASSFENRVFLLPHTRRNRSNICWLKFSAVQMNYSRITEVMIHWYPASASTSSANENVWLRGYAMVFPFIDESNCVCVVIDESEQPRNKSMSPNIIRYDFVIVSPLYF